MTLIAQLSDLHLRDDGADPFHDPAGALRAAFRQIAAMAPAPAAILLTGDLIDRSAGGYARVLDLLAEAPLPVLPMPGNHDRAAEFRAAFAGFVDYAPGHLSFARQVGGIRIVALDSNLPQGAGLDAERLDWLEAVLAQDRMPVLLALHHPPFPTGVPRIDSAGFAGQARLEALLRGSAVRRIAAGHTHVAIQTRWAGIPAGTAPALAHALALEFAEGAAGGPQPGPPGFELHLIGETITASFPRFLPPA